MLISHDNNPEHLIATISALRNYTRVAMENVDTYTNEAAIQGIYFSFFASGGVCHMMSVSDCRFHTPTQQELASSLGAVRYIEPKKAGFYSNEKGDKGYFASIHCSFGPHRHWCMISRGLRGTLREMSSYGEVPNEIRRILRRLDDNEVRFQPKVERKSLRDINL